MSYSLTPQQQRCLDLIKAGLASTGKAPTVRELRVGLGLASMGHTHGLLEALEERGHIVRLPHRARAIRVLDQSSLRSAVRLVLTSCQLSPECRRELQRFDHVGAV